jgi:hypothetical protein
MLCIRRTLTNTKFMTLLVRSHPDLMDTLDHNELERAAGDGRDTYV